MPLYYDAELRAGADYRPEVWGGNGSPAWADDFLYASHVPQTISGTLSGGAELPTVLASGGFTSVLVEMSGAAILPTVEAIGGFAGLRVLGSLSGSARRTHAVRRNIQTATR